MYIHETMINLGLKKNEEFKSKIHEQVAKSICLCNPHINTRDQLINNIEILQSITKEELETMTLGQLADKGVII